MKKGHLLMLLFLLLFSMLFVETKSLIGIQEWSTLHSNQAISVNELKDNINFSAIMKHIRIISSMGSRVTGYPGYKKVADYIKNVMESYDGVSVEIQKYKVPVPVEKLARINVLSPIKKEFKAHILWPNGVQTSSTPPGGLTGNLIYVADGELKQFDGKRVEDSIVLMEFNSEDNWLNAARLGAKAVIFIEPDTSDYLQSLKKFIDAPLYMPRLYVSKDVGSFLKMLVTKSQEPVQIKIESRMFYEEVEGINIIAKINGTLNPNDVIVITAHYDTWSCVPAVSFGAREAISVSVLLELARYFSVHKPAKTVWLVALSGHWQALAGAREFVEEYYFSEDVQSGKVKPWVLLDIGLLSPEGNQMAVLGGVGHLYGIAVQGFESRFLNVELKLKREYLVDNEFRRFIREVVGVDPESFIQIPRITTMWFSTEPVPFLIDSEPAALAGCVAFTLNTAYDYKLWRGLPLNDLSEVDSEKLKPQIVTIAFIAASFANDPNLGWNWNTVYPRRISYEAGKLAYAGLKDYAGYVTAYGKVVEFNFTKGWYTPISGAIVQISPWENWYPFAKIIAISDEHGNFIVHGLPQSVMVQAQAFQSVLATWTRRVYAWKLNKTDGQIIYAPDMGVYGAQSIRPYIQTMYHPTNFSTAVMKCVPVSIFDPIDPRSLRSSRQPDIRDSRMYYLDLGGIVTPLDFIRKSDFLSYGYYYNEFDPLVIIFVKSGTSLALTMKMGGRGVIKTPKPVMVLTNSDEKHPEGVGYKITSPTIIPFSLLKIVKDVFNTANMRYKNLMERGAKSLNCEFFLSKAEKSIEQAEKYYDNYEYSKAYAEALDAFSWSYRAYSEVMTLIDDTSNSSLFFFSIIVIGTILLERLLFHREDGKERLIIMTGISTFIMFIFSWVHPALTIMSNSLMAILGIVIMLLFAIVIVVLLRDVERVSKALSEKLLGYHAYESGRVSSIIVSFSISIEHLRRRRFRSILTITAILITVAALVAFTSTSYYTAVNMTSTLTGSNYDGILIKSQEALPPNGPLEEYLVTYLQNLVGDKMLIQPRIWCYPQSRPEIGPKLDLFSEQGSAMVSCVLGLAPSEMISLAEKYALKGTAPLIPLIEGNLHEGKLVILPSSAAERLKVEVGDDIKAFGMYLKVVAIVDDELMSAAYDLDGEPMTPVDPLFYTPLSRIPIQQAAMVTYPRLPWSDVIIVPYRLALHFGGYISSISLKPVENVTWESLNALASEISYARDLDIYVGWKGSVFRSSKVISYKVLGWENLIVLVVIGSLNIINFILASIKERQGEIHTINSLGLSPTGVVFMFIVETAVYAFISILLGYFLGYFLNMTGIKIGLLPPNFVFNFASVSMVIVLGIILVSSFAASIYPAVTAFKIATPGIERKWKLPTKPRGDEWEIPLMARIASRTEGLGFLEFMREYYLGAGAAGRGYMVDEVGEVSYDQMEFGARIRLSPYEAQIVQQVNLKVFEAEGAYHISIYIKRISGTRDLWIGSNPVYIDSLRKQVLTWRSLSPEQKQRYFKIVKEKEKRM